MTPGTATANCDGTRAVSASAAVGRLGRAAYSWWPSLTIMFGWRSLSAFRASRLLMLGSDSGERRGTPGARGSVDLCYSISSTL